VTTIGRHYTGRLPNYATTCDVCGVSWHRSDLRRTANGTLVCPDDSAGMVEQELAQANAAGVSDTSLPRGGGRR
jgi:hypothetical protein